jgi:hypothetical protein
MLLQGHIGPERKEKKRTNNAVDGRSMKKKPCERVTKMSAWEMIATCFSKDDR